MPELPTPVPNRFTILWLAEGPEAQKQRVEQALSLARAGAAEACVRWPAIFGDRAQLLALSPSPRGEAAMLAEVAAGLDCSFSVLDADDPTLVSESDLVVVAREADLARAGLAPALVLCGHIGETVLFSQGGPDHLFPDRRRIEDALPFATPEAIADAAFAPPPDEDQRRKLADFLGEGKPAAPVKERAYDWLLRLIGEARQQDGSVDRSWELTRDLAAQATPSAVARIEALHATYRRADALAMTYGAFWRGSLVSRSMLLLLTNAISGLIGALWPEVSTVTIPIQVTVTAITFYNSRVARRDRWLEKWLDYRRLAESLRVARFLTLGGVSPDQRRPADWTTWMALRVGRSGPPPAALPDDAALKVLDHLTKVEIAGQIAYHQAAFARFSRLDRDLRRAALVALCAFVALGFGLAALAFSGHFQHRFGLAAAIGMALTAAPAIYALLNGVRRDFDVVRQADRSRALAENLQKFSEIAAKLPPCAVTARAACARAADIMRDDVARWRNVIEVL